MIEVAVGIVTGSETRKNRDSDTDRLLLQVRLSDIDDIQTVEFMSNAGDDTHPPLDSKVLVLSAGEAWKIAVASDDDVVPSMAVGEKKLYSTSGGSIQAYINLLSDGTIEINGNADFAVRFTALETAFNQLKSDYNSHTHVSVTSVGTPTVPVPQSTADMSGAKVNEVKLS